MTSIRVIFFQPVVFLQINYAIFTAIPTKTKMKRRTFVQFAISSSGIVLLNPLSVFAKANKEIMKVTMLYNNIGDSDTMENDWGLSIWIEDKDEAILFDTGGNPKILMDNLAKTDIDFSRLSKIVLSHNHKDHTDGLIGVLEKSDYKPEVYVAMHDLEDYKIKHPKAKIIGVETPVKLTPSISTTAQLVNPRNEVHELSVVVHKEKSVYLMTGCSHSGIVDMVDHVTSSYPKLKMEQVMGGFHLRNKNEPELIEISNDLKKLGVKNLAASHCTGDLALEIFRKEWGENFIDFNLGDESDI